MAERVLTERHLNRALLARRHLLERSRASRFPPTWDAALLVHARRTGIMPEEHRPLVFDTKTPHSVTTFLAERLAASHG